jgi:anti-sigma regulatory factor (Ser/Thr protein kinase)
MTPAVLLVAIDDPSGVAEARRRASTMAERLDFGSTAAGQLAIAVTELGTNIVKHARRGSIVLRCVQASGTAGIEVTAIDGGPGMANVAESLRDGHSTAGSPGTGLGALKRLTTGFEIYTQPGKGMVARFEAWPAGAPASAPGVLPQGAICLPKSGEAVCGDDWALLSWRGRHALFLVDGLGHGPDAAQAARVAVETAAKGIQLSAVDLIASVHDALRPTRGAAAAVAMLEPGKELCTYCGIGNIATSVRSNGATRSMVSHNGILGHQVRKIQDFSYPFPRGALCIAHSDGVSARWDLAAYPGLEQRHPSLVAAVLYRDHARERDDATIAAVRNEEQGR